MAPTALSRVTGGRFWAIAPETDDEDNDDPPTSTTPSGSLTPSQAADDARFCGYSAAEAATFIDIPVTDPARKLQRLERMRGSDDDLKADLVRRVVARRSAAPWHGPLPAVSRTRISFGDVLDSG